MNAKKKRSSGVLLHISSLPSPYGVGSLGHAAYRFVDFLKSSKQSYWQILPLGPTSYGDSPYQVVSAFAGNPYFIDLGLLIEEGLITEKELLDVNFGDDPHKTDYYKLFLERVPVLKKAHSRGKELYHDEISRFRLENEAWLEDYALYMALKYEFKQKPYYEWNRNIVRRDPRTLKRLKMELREEINFWIFTQYLFFSQWHELKKYANENGISIIGDLPIYVGRDSVDLWSNPSVFCLDRNFNPNLVSGVPPDDFSIDGQLWGNPVYDWEYLKFTDYGWWINRLSHDLKLFDNLRIDHFRGFESFWVVPSDSKTARDGSWVKGPGMDFFSVMENKLGKLDLIAEDLGFLTPEVHRLKEETGYMGMKILQFAFDKNPDNPYLPHNFEKNSVVYTGTHDNDTICGWLSSLNGDTAEFIKEYLRICEQEETHWGIISGAFSSVSDLAIFPLQDLLGIDSDGRMNTPSTESGNWTWRMKSKDLSEDLAYRLARLTNLYGR